MDSNDNLSIDKLEAAMETLRELAPPKVEIWTMEHMPHRDEEGEPVVIVVNVHEANMAMRVRWLALPPTPFETVTGADQVIIMHPMTLRMLPESQDYNMLAPGIPIFDDEYRRAYFARQAENSKGGIIGG